MVVVVVVDDVDVEVDVLDEEDVATLVVDVLLVVVGTTVVVVDVVEVVPAVVDTTVLVLACDSVVRDGEAFEASHPIATRTRLMVDGVTSLVNRLATRDSATLAVWQRRTSISRRAHAGGNDASLIRDPATRSVVSNDTPR